MTSRIEVFGALESAIEALLAKAATERGRALQALCEIEHLKKEDFSEHLEASYFERIKGFGKELKSRTINDEHMRLLRATFWALYQLVEKSLRPGD